MTLTKQQHKILDIMLKLDRDTKPNEIENLYREKYKQIGESSVYKQLERMAADGFIKRVSHGKYSVTDRCLALLKNGEASPEKSIRFTDEEIEEFKEFAKQKDSLELLAEILNPSLLGLQKERLGALIAIVSAKDKYGDRNRVSVLLSGAPSLGKTQIIKWCQMFLWGHWIDSDASESSLRGTGKGFQFTEGVLQRADNSVLYVDEIDKMNKKDQEALLSAIELGSVKINKDRVERETSARIRIIATCNEKGRIIEQLLNRFDIQFDVKKLSEEERDRLIRKKTNDWNREKLSIKSADFLKKYLIFVNQWETALPSDREWINGYLLKELKYGVLQNKDPRQIEAIYRISISIGKLRLHPEVTMDDLKRAIEILE